jgi:hypothetical protein
MVANLRRRLRPNRTRTYTDPRIARLMRRNPNRLQAGKRAYLLDQLLQSANGGPHGTGDDFGAMPGGDVRRAVLQVLLADPGLVTESRVAAFLAEQVEQDDLDELAEAHPRELAKLYTILYAYGGDDEAHTERIRGHAVDLLRGALRQLEDRGEFGRIVDLLRMAPTPPGMEEDELSHWRHLALLHEFHRTQLNRRILYIYLAVQFILILVVYPLLFQNAENGVIQRQLENASGLEMNDTGHRRYSYGTALYWTVITATSVGYGDITPETAVGRAIALVLGVSGVVTIGVVGGLVLRWITPRELP